MKIKTPTKVFSVVKKKPTKARNIKRVASKK